MNFAEMNAMGIKKAILLNGLSKYVNMVIQIVLSMILARLVSPTDYGIISIITVILNFLALIADMGLGVTVIQHPEMKRERIYELFSFTVLFGFCISFILYLFSFPLSVVYDNEIYYGLCPFAAIVSFFNTINIVPNSLLVRDKKFDTIAFRTIICTLIPGAIAVVLAMKGAGVFSLLVQSISTAILNFTWNYLKNPLKLKMFSLKTIYKLLGKYSLFQFMFNIMNYGTRNLDNLIIGATFGEANLGYYNKAYTLNLYPNNIFTSVITGVLHPYIRDKKSNFKLLEKKLIEMLKMLSLVGLFVTITCYLCSREIILIMFGDNWAPAIYCFKGLSICILSQMLSSVSGSVFLGVERTDQTFKCGVINLCLILVAIFTGVCFNSLNLLSYAIGVTYNIIFFITYVILIKYTLNGDIKSFFGHFVADYLAVIIFCIVFNFVDLDFDSIFVSVIIKISIVALYFIGYLICSGQVRLLKKSIWALIK